MSDGEATKEYEGLATHRQAARTFHFDGVLAVETEIRVEVDAIIYGTGFAATEFLAPMTITGRDGQDLNEAWQQGAQAYLALAGELINRNATTSNNGVANG